MLESMMRVLQFPHHVKERSMDWILAITTTLWQNILARDDILHTLFGSDSTSPTNNNNNTDPITMLGLVCLVVLVVGGISIVLYSSEFKLIRIFYCLAVVSAMIAVFRVLLLIPTNTTTNLPHHQGIGRGGGGQGEGGQGNTHHHYQHPSSSSRSSSTTHYTGTALLLRRRQRHR